MKDDFREDLGIGLEADLGARLIGRAELLQFARHHAFGELHRPDVTAATDFGFEPLATGVDGGDADAVQTAGAGLVAARTIELAAGVDLGEDDFKCGTVIELRHRSDGNAAAVVDAGDRAVGVDANGDGRRVLVDVLIDAVVDDFVHKMMQADGIGAADVHRGPHPNALDPFEVPDVVFGVVIARRNTAGGGCIGTHGWLLLLLD